MKSRRRHPSAVRGLESRLIHRRNSWFASPLPPFKAEESAPKQYIMRKYRKTRFSARQKCFK